MCYDTHHLLIIDASRQLQIYTFESEGIELNELFENRVSNHPSCYMRRDYSDCYSPIGKDVRPIRRAERQLRYILVKKQVEDI